MREHCGLARQSPRCKTDAMKPLIALSLLALAATSAAAAPVARHVRTHSTQPPRAEGAAKTDTSQPAKEYFHASEVRSMGTVIVGGQPIAYDAVAGTLVVHAKGWEDTDALDSGSPSSPDNPSASANAPTPAGPKPEA